jgi:hypothetical protein
VSFIGGWVRECTCAESCGCYFIVTPGAITILGVVCKVPVSFRFCGLGREVAVPAIACEASAVVAALDDLRVDELRVWMGMASS